MKTIKKAELVHQLSFSRKIGDGTTVVRREVAPGLQSVEGHGEDAIFLLIEQEIEKQLRVLFRDLPDILNKEHMPGILRKINIHHEQQVARIMTAPPQIMMGLLAFEELHYRERRQILHVLVGTLSS